MTNDQYVAFRLAHGSLCHVCPARGQRMVGCDGPSDADVVGIGEAPGEDEEKWGKHRGARYGTPFVGASGYKLRRDNLAKADLVDVVETHKKPYPELRNLRAFLHNVVMCRPPENEIGSAVGRRMVECCQNSFYAVTRKLLEQNPNRTFVAVGATAATALRRRETKIDGHRGRVTHHENVQTWIERKCAPADKEAIYKRVLRGVKPKEVWWTAFEQWMKSFVRLWRTTARGVERERKKSADGCFLEANPWLTEWSKTWKKQKAALAKARRLSAPDLSDEADGDGF